MRAVSLDTETTGFLSPDNRIVELAAVEMINGIATGNRYHQYVNPKRDVPEEAFKVHGLSYDFLKQYPTLEEVIDEFLAFIGDSLIVAHNGQAFDIPFINMELKRLGREPLANELFDSMIVAKKMLPQGSRVSLDALCKRYKIDNSNRTLHGALIDADLLAQVYLELIGGRALEMDLGTAAQAEVRSDLIDLRRLQWPERPRMFALPTEQEAHDKFVGGIKDSIWAKYNSVDAA
jgi:DNA polymerase-3 subunit epsilon